MTDSRLDQVELELERMASRIRRLELEQEGGVAVREVPRDPEPPPNPLAEAWQRPSERPVPSRPARPPISSAPSFEELFGGRVLAWLGGLAILLGAVLFLGMAISHGWIDETARTVIAAVASFALLAGGVWLHERQGKTEAARAAVASGVSGLYATLVVATQAYDLISPGLGLGLAALVAGVGFLIAVRWSSPVVAAVGSLGALAAPLLVGIDPSGTSIAFVAVALAATVGILLWQRWDWLALGAFVVSAPQLVAWAVRGQHDHLVLVLAVLVGFWALYAAAAFGHELRARDREALPVASWLLLLGSSALVVLLGYQLLETGISFEGASYGGHHTAAVLWLFGFAAVHLLLGAAAMRSGIHREIGALLSGTGIVIAAFGCAAALDGPALVIAWAAGAAALAALATRVDAEPDPAFSNAERLLFAAGGFLGLAAIHTLVIEAPPRALVEGVEDLGVAATAVGACAVAAVVCALCARRVSPAGAKVAGFAAATALVYLGSVAIVDTVGVDSFGEAIQSGQVWLSAFWTVTGLGAVVWGLVRRSPSVRLGGLALLGIAIAKVWTYDLAELEELARVLSFVGLGLLLLAGAYAYQRIKPGDASEEDEADRQPPRVSR
jgi:uncharacterized membrane protein